ncbi:Tripartite tricarboxylate transporter family receptor (plasmid) [Variovorax sp. SRS16]|uniref:Bug family tripartite tricarboxylate transporter substrate binding protein n=1 Tax=Variovorax sp. SRS16 TaxID=282217 RepID=UPI0013191CA9|nr:tripartite tricarboxylate transporter substrate binding protein [Variovorax sp. SRS16]VTU46511.1 Tripartite tricarboxylate transporter family receptor [Variovorax sp. SRS16]
MTHSPTLATGPALNRRGILAVLLGSLLGANARAAAWKPTGQVEYVIPSAAGGAVDIYGRVMKKFFDTHGSLGGQAMIITNRPGGQGMIAAAPVVQRPGDADIFTMLSTGFMLGQILGDYKHDLLKDFTIGPILFEEALVVAVKADSPIRNAADMVARLKKDPGSLRIAVAPGLNNHIHIAILKPLKLAGVATEKLTVAPFRSSAESVVALRGDHVDVVSASAANLVTGVTSGALRVIAVSSAARLPGALAHVPTWKEQGIDSVYTSVEGILFPPRITAEQIAFWDERFRELSRSPEWAATLQEYEVTPRFMDHAQARAFVASELEESSRLLHALGMVS